MGGRGETERWAPGTQILWRYDSGRGRPYIDPVTVVADDESGLVAWLAAGTEVLHNERVDGRDVRAVKSEMFDTELVGVRTTWKHNDVLRIAPVGMPWSVWLLWDHATHVFGGWYGNIEAPLRRGPGTVLSRDYTLDVVVTPDRRRHRKDEDELEIARRAGRYSDREVEWILGVASDLEAVIDRWGPPFCDGWETFVPDPAWPLPPLPAF